MLVRGSIVAALLAPGMPAAAQTERPPVGPERPFQLAPRVERTLSNGLRVIVTRQTVVPKVTVMLTVLSGFSSDPPELTGLAALTADAVMRSAAMRVLVSVISGEPFSAVEAEASTTSIDRLIE